MVLYGERIFQNTTSAVFDAFCNQTFKLFPETVISKVATWNLRILNFIFNFF